MNRFSLGQIYRRLFNPRPASSQQRRKQNNSPVRRTVRPCLEALEDRLVPALFTPTVFTDGIAGGTLREAVINANSDNGTDPDTIQLSAGTYTLTTANTANNHEVSSTQGDLNITNSKHALVIQGTTDANGNPTSLIEQFVSDRVFQIVNLNGGSAAAVTFKDVILEGGFAVDDGGAGAVIGESNALGGGILDQGGNVTLSNVVVRTNQAASGASHSAQGGGIFAQNGALTINHSVIQNNTAVAGSSVTPLPAQGGGIFVQDGALTITNSVLQNNTATGGEGGGEADGGGVYYALMNLTTPQLSITNSTVAKNTAQGGAGTSNADGGNANGGGVYAISGDNATLITGSTLSGNAAFGGLGVNGTADGIGHGGGASIGGNATVVNSTIAANRVTGGEAAGGGVYFARRATGQFTNATVVGNKAELSSTLGTAEGGGLDDNNGNTSDVTLTNTLVAGNAIKTSAGSPQSPDVRGQLVSNGHNLIGIADGVNDPGFTAPGDLAGSLASPLDPKLGPLQNNEGPTQTMLPLAGSPALGGGDPAVAPSTDQRGVARPAGGPTDIGAVQVSAVSPSPSPSPAPSPPPAFLAPPTLQVPPLLAFINSLLGGIETINSNGTETITDSIFGIPLFRSTFDSAGNLLSTTLVGIDITFLFR